MLVKSVFKSKLSLILTGLLIVSLMAIPFVVNAIHSHAVHAANASSTPVNSAFPDLPPGFAKTQLAQGLKNPSVFAFAPNGGPELIPCAHLAVTRGEQAKQFELL